MRTRLRVSVGVAVVAALSGVAVAAFMAVEDLDLLTATYLVIITLSTVGFSEPAGGFSAEGQLVAIWLIVIGVGVVLYTVSSLADIVLEAVSSDRKEREREAKKIVKLSSHLIICGYGRVGRRVHKLLTRNGGRSAVVIDSEFARIERAREDEALAVQGDAVRDEYLEAAGIDRADALIACVGAEGDNLAIVLSARARRPDLYIVARGGDSESRRKLRLAGADRVVTLEAAGAERLAVLAERRELTEFVEVISGEARLEFQIEELPVGPRASFVDIPLQDSGIRAEHGVLVLAIHHSDGMLSAPPAPATPIRNGDVLVALGTSEQLARLRPSLGS
ncbi:MAG: potassium channel family protein [Acidimicrobiia bacterium]